MNNIILNAKYAPGVPTYGTSGKDGEKGENGRSLFFLPFNISNNLIFVQNLINNNKIYGVENIDYTYKIGDSFVQPDGDIYQYVSYGNIVKTGNFIFSNDTFFNKDDNGNFIYNNTPYNFIITDKKDSIENINNDNYLFTIDSNDGNFLKMKTSDGEMTISFDNVTNGFVFSSDNPIYFDNLFAIKDQSDTKSKKTSTYYKTNRANVSTNVDLNSSTFPGSGTGGGVFDNSLNAFLNTQIYYTSTDGNKISFTNSDVLTHESAGGGYIITFKNKLNKIGAKWFENKENLKTIKFNNAIKKIGTEAFRNCKYLEKVEIPESGEMETIEQGAFGLCRNLKTINLPNSITYIGLGAFYNCTSIKNITLPSNINTINDSTFDGCASLQKMDIPLTVSYIGARAFYNCTNLSEVNFKSTTPPELCNVSEKLKPFHNTSKNLIIYVPIGYANVYGNSDTWSSYKKNIYGYDENSSQNPEQEDIPDTRKIFYKTTDDKIINLDGINFGVNITNSTYENKLGVIYFDNDVIYIPRDAFKDKTTLKEITIPNSVKIINKYAFDNCNNLEKITLGSIIKEINEAAFSRCYNLTSVTIPDSVTMISRVAFYECKNIKNIIIPNNVESIGELAFCRCENLEEVTIIGEEKKEIGDCIFRDCPKLNKFNGKFASEDGRCLIVNGVLNSFAPADITEYTIPNDVLTIGAYTFKRSKITKIKLHENIKEIGKAAFEGCRELKEVYCYPTEPPKLTEDIFTEIKEDFKIYVPTDSVNAYKSANIWENYQSKITPLNADTPEDTPEGDEDFTPSEEYQNVINTFDVSIIDTSNITNPTTYDISNYIYELNIFNSSNENVVKKIVQLDSSNEINISGDDIDKINVNDNLSYFIITSKNYFISKYLEIQKEKQQK